MKVNLDYEFNQIYLGEGLYTVEEFESDAFIEFEDRFNSLHRYWLINSRLIRNYLQYMNSYSIDEYEEEFHRLQKRYTLEYDNLEPKDKMITPDPSEMTFGPAAFDFGKDNINSDITFFSEHLRLSTISYALALVENLLATLSKEVSTQANVKIEMDKRKIPFINKYILWFTKGLGFDLVVQKSMWKELDAIRSVRNRYIHQISRELPQDIKKVIGSMISNATQEIDSINDEFVDRSLESLSDLVLRVEKSYINYNRKK